MGPDFTSLLRFFACSSRSHADSDYIYSQLALHTDLRQYLYDFPIASKAKLITAFALERVSEGQTLFSKGDASDKMYVLLSGLLEMYDDHGLGPVLIATLAGGKVIGERGLARRTSRLLTAVSKVESYMLSLDLASFVETLGPVVAMRIEEKVAFIEAYIPKARLLPLSLKERLAYAFSPVLYKRGHRLLSQGEMSPFLFFVKSGECSATHQRTKIVTLTVGCWFGDESILLSKPSSYAITVSSESAWLYTLTRSEAMKLIPEPVIEVMRRQCAWKNTARRTIETRLRVLVPPPLDLKTVARFNLASPSAKRSLLKVTDRSPKEQEKETKIHNLLKQRLFLHTPSLHRLRSSSSIFPRPFTSRDHIL